MLQPPEVLLRLAQLRQKAREGTMTFDDMREGIELLRREREKVPQATSGSKVKKEPAEKRPRKSKKQAEPPLDSGSLLDELKGL